MGLFSTKSVGIGAWEYYIDFLKQIPYQDSLKQEKLSADLTWT